MRDFKLYVILSTDICKGDIQDIARKIISADADILQLRPKNIPDRRVLEIGRVIKKLAAKSKSSFLVNDRLDLAWILDADGIHLGQEDLPLKDARRLLGKRKIIGISTHSVEEAHRAEAEGADYIAIGPIFNTATKRGHPPLTPAVVTKIKQRIKIPFVAIGGINLDNIEEILAYGAGRVAISSAIITAEDVVSVTRKFRERLYR